jgi:hypothetical protein
MILARMLRSVDRQETVSNAVNLVSLLAPDTARGSTVNNLARTCRTDRERLAICLRDPFHVNLTQLGPVCCHIGREFSTVTATSKTCSDPESIQEIPDDRYVDPVALRRLVSIRSSRFASLRFATDRSWINTFGT